MVILCLRLSFSTEQEGRVSLPQAHLHWTTQIFLQSFLSNGFYPFYPALTFLLSTKRPRVFTNKRFPTITHHFNLSVPEIHGGSLFICSVPSSPTPSPSSPTVLRRGDTFVFQQRNPPLSRARPQKPTQAIAVETDSRESEGSLSFNGH